MSMFNKIVETSIGIDVAKNEILNNSKMNKQEKEILKNIHSGTLYLVDNKKRKDLLKVYASDYKSTMNKKHKWVYTFYLTSIILLFAVLLSTIICLILINDNFDKIVISSLVLILGLILDILPYSAYKMSINKDGIGEFYYRTKEKVIFNNSGFDYYFYDKRINYLNGIAMFKYSVNYGKIEKVLYDDRVKELEIRGVKCYQYIGNNKWKPLNYTGVSILETYKTNILEKFKENSVLIENMNYLKQREIARKAMEEQISRCVNE